ncbi:NUDIX domain-containing protein [Candidatus Pacearchaeota archaeon]|nr:NUDIX domain-containing protein [Candidatus Pacearchaeota archaeon]
MRKAVRGLAIRDGKVLLVRKNETWILPGGKPEKRESDIECLCREFKEELPSVEIENISYYDSFAGRTPHKKDMLKAEVYFVDISEGIGKPSKEINCVKWVSDFPDYNISDITSKVIKSLREKDYL